MQIIHSTSTSPAFNLAAEEYLFNERQDDLLFLYVNEPSVIIGCNQAIRNEVNLQFCAENDIKIVRRMSGGGAVYHDEGNLNFCFISNKIEGKSSLNDDFLKPIVDVLTDLGIAVEIGNRKDLWLEEKYKISGTASHIIKNRELHHGTLLYETDLEMLKNALNAQNKDETVRAIASVRSTVKNLRMYLDEQGKRTFSLIHFSQIIINKLLEYYNQYKINILSENDIIKIKHLEINKYCQKEWTYKK